MNATHTPGPWEIRHETPPWDTIPKLLLYSPSVGGPLVDAGGVGYPMAEANARLIAEAPAMVAEIRALLSRATYADGQAIVLTQDCEALEAILARIDGGSNG